VPSPLAFDRDSTRIFAHLDGKTEPLRRAHLANGSHLSSMRKVVGVARHRSHDSRADAPPPTHPMDAISRVSAAFRSSQFYQDPARSRAMETTGRRSERGASARSAPASNERPAQPRKGPRAPTDPLPGRLIRRQRILFHPLEVLGVDSNAVTRSFENRSARAHRGNAYPVRQLLGLLSKNGTEPRVTQPHERKLPKVRDALVRGLAP
jgi:hypothetical protein